MKWFVALTDHVLRSACRLLSALKYWMGATHFLTKTLARVSTEMSLHPRLQHQTRDEDHGHRCDDRSDPAPEGSFYLRTEVIPAS